MNSFSKIAAFIPFGVLLLVATLWSGCHSVEVDDSASVYENLNTAKSEAQAKQAIMQVLRLTKIAHPDADAPLSGYAPTEDALDRLSKAQAAFNSGDAELGVTFREVYEMVLSVDRPPSVDLEIVMEIVREVVNVSHVDEEREVYVPILNLALTDGDALVESVGIIDSDAAVSPFRALMFAIWLHDQGPGLGYLELSDDVDVVGKTAYTTPLCTRGSITGTHYDHTSLIGPTQCGTNTAWNAEPGPVCPSDCVAGISFPPFINGCWLGNCNPPGAGGLPGTTAHQECYQSFVTCQGASAAVIPACQTALTTCLAAHPD